MSFKNLVLVLALLSFSAMASAEDPGSFEVFYKEDSSIGWPWVVGGAVLAGGAVLLTGGTASPLVAGIGSWVGSMMGLSGAAATSAGLATLGFGSLASGGLGMVGGTAVVTAGLALAGDAALDKGLGVYLTERRYQALAEYSESMSTLCLPRNQNGSDAYEKAVESLQSVRFCSEEAERVTRDNLYQRLDQVINKLKRQQKKEEVGETVKEDVLLSLLYFIRNDYRRAHFYADLVLDYHGRDKDGLAQYLYAVTSLYVKGDSYPVLVDDYLRPALLEDEENPLIPQLLGIFVERSLLAASLGNISWGDPVALLGMLDREESLSRFRPRVAAALLDSYVQAGRELQGRIKALEDAVNPLIQKAPQTQKRIEALRVDYAGVRATGAVLVEAISEDPKLMENEHVGLLLQQMNCLLVGTVDCGTQQEMASL